MARQSPWAFTVQGVGAVAGSLVLIALICFAEQSSTDCDATCSNSEGSVTVAPDSIWCRQFQSRTDETGEKKRVRLDMAYSLVLWASFNGYCRQLVRSFFDTQPESSVTECMHLYSHDQSSGCFWSKKKNATFVCVSPVRSFFDTQPESSVTEWMHLYSHDQSSGCFWSKKKNATFVCVSPDV